MADLFEHFQDVDIPAVRKKAIEDGLEEGLKRGLEQGLERGLEQGLAQGLEQGRAEGETRLVKLIQILMQTNRMDDLTEALNNSLFREKLYQQYNI